jgi:hypothetical protein
MGNGNEKNLVLEIALQNDFILNKKQIIFFFLQLLSTFELFGFSVFLSQNGEPDNETYFFGPVRQDYKEVQS